MRKNTESTRTALKNPWKGLGLTMPSRDKVLKNTTTVIVAMAGMGTFVALADAMTTWLVSLL
ncbi:preprotein translocase subunit SecE [Clostridium porci]|uniref:Preprotein translocase subunit SecE n=1 Tax=Clostridium porci TaxID=2605778 RepID=A0A7X2NKV0_9CLOT|nr:preprotein translocase subunit SecE [Clostridium porci]MSS36545.1 preprotein translocase subunit SecE [Clostridium porci]